MNNLQQRLIFSALFITLILTTTALDLKPQTSPTPINTSTPPSQAEKSSLAQAQLAELITALEQGNNAHIPLPINKVITDNTVTCKQKNDFMNKVNDLLTNKLKTNQQQLKALQSITPGTSSANSNLNTVLNSKTSSKNYDQQISMLENLKKSLENKNFDVEIKLRETQKNLIVENITKFTKAAEGYLNQLKQFKKKNNIVSDTKKQETAINLLQAQLEKNYKNINQTLSRRSQLHKNMTQLKLAILYQEMASRQGQSSEQLQQLYRKYNQQYIQTTIIINQKQQQLSRLQQQLKSKQQSPTTVDDEITKITKQLDQLKGPNAQNAITIITQANQVLSSNIKAIDDKIKSIEMECII